MVRICAFFMGLCPWKSVLMFEKPTVIGEGMALSRKGARRQKVAQFLPGICVWTRVPMPICISKPSEGVSKCRETLGSGTRRARAVTQGWAFPSWSLRRPTVIV